MISERDVSVMDIQALRKGAADKAFEDYDFGADSVEDSNGWKIDGDEFSKVFFLSNPDGGDSIKGHFTVDFEECASVVMSAEAAYD
jgi:hypothetical protein